MFKNKTYVSIKITTFTRPIMFCFISLVEKRAMHMVETRFDEKTF